MAENEKTGKENSWKTNIQEKRAAANVIQKNWPGQNKHSALHIYGSVHRVCWVTSKPVGIMDATNSEITNDNNEV
jgi:hypothetical protein